MIGRAASRASLCWRSQRSQDAAMQSSARMSAAPPIVSPPASIVERSLSCRQNRFSGPPVLAGEIPDRVHDAGHVLLIAGGGIGLREASTVVVEIAA